MYLYLIVWNSQHALYGHIIYFEFHTVQILFTEQNLFLLTSYNFLEIQAVLSVY